MLLNGQLYKKLGNGVLDKCISENLVMEILDQIHSKVCGLEGPTLARRLERLGYFWPNLKRKTVEVQRSCEQCHLVMEKTALSKRRIGDKTTLTICYTINSQKVSLHPS